MKEIDSQILFIYNAKADIFSTLTDFVHKILSPATYPCSLCKLTHGNLGVHKKWVTFLETLPYQTNFLHKEEAELNDSLHGKHRLPVILIKSNKGKSTVLLKASELNNLTSLDELIEKLSTKLQNYRD